MFEKYIDSWIILTYTDFKLKHKNKLSRESIPCNYLFGNEPDG